MRPAPTVTFGILSPPTVGILGSYGHPPTPDLAWGGPPYASTLSQRVRLSAPAAVTGLTIWRGSFSPGELAWTPRILRDADASVVAFGPSADPVTNPYTFPIVAVLDAGVDYRVELLNSAFVIPGLASVGLNNLPTARSGLFVAPAAGESFHVDGAPASYQMCFELLGGDPVLHPVPVDVTCLVETASIRHGRSDPSSQPEASTVTLDVWGELPAGVDIGTACTVDATVAGVGYRRFAGAITDLTVGWDTPNAPVARVVAVGQLGRMGNRVIGTAVYPLELDGARANRAITAAGVPTDAARTDPGTVQVLSRDKDPQDALSIAHDAAEDGDGMLWQAKDGVVLYADADHRRDAGVGVALDACVIPIGLEWQRNLQGLVNDVTVSAPVEAHYSDPASIAKYGGVFSTSLSTRLASAYDAENLALLTLARQADPAWVLSGLAVDLQMISAVYSADPAADEATTADLLDLEVHDLVSVLRLPAGSPQPSAVLWVEGWTETVTRDQWRLELAVADYCRNASLEIWDDVDAAITWDTAPDVPWDDIVCSPPTGVGTWNDVPSRTHWDTVPATITWDTAEDLWPS